MLSRSGDYAAALLLRFYAVYRALVRAKVAAIRMRQNAGGESELLAYVSLAEQLAASNPGRLVITHGLSGCGKTFASDQLLLQDAQASTLRLRSDVERRRLFGLGGGQRSGAALDGGIYAAAAHVQTYTRLRDLASMLLASGWSVVVDATFLKRADRDALHALAQSAGADFAILAPSATEQQLRQRIEARQALGRDASEATAEVLVQQMRSMEPLQPDEVRFCLDPVSDKFASVAVSQ